MAKFDEIREQLEARLIKADWSIWATPYDPSAFPCWFYSASLPRGPRIGGQIGKQFYEEMERGSGAFKQIDRSGKNPGDLLYDVITGFEEESRPVHSNSLSQGLMLALAAYARSTRTWQSLPRPSVTDGVHFVALDWVTEEGKRVLRPLGLISKVTPPPAKFIEGMLAQVAMHLERFPAEWPVEIQ